MRHRKCGSLALRWCGIILLIPLLIGGSSLRGRVARPGHLMCVELWSGVLTFVWAQTPMPAGAEDCRFTLVRPRISFLPGRGWSSRTEWGGPGNFRTFAYEFSLPLWIPAALVLLPTARAWVAWGRSRRRHAAGCCINCGYSLVGAPLPCCPECGRPADEARTI